MRRGILTLVLLWAGYALTPVLYAEPLLDEGFREMYNLRFSEAQKIFAQYQKDNPKDPLGPVFEAATYLFTEFDRLKILQEDFWGDTSNFLDSHRLPADPSLKASFEAALARAEKLAAPGLATNPPDQNAMFATVLRLGLHSDYAGIIEKRSLTALSEIKQSRTLANQLLAMNPEYYDAYIAEAIENYLLSYKPAPVRWVLRMTGSQTDRQTGIARLNLTSEKGHYLKPYARLLYAVAELREHRPDLAKQMIEWLAHEYPGNHLYQEELAKLR